MPLPNRDGRFKAAIVEHGVAETGRNNLATFVCRFRLVEELVSGEWVPLDEDFEITGYFYLEKRDGSLNSVVIEQIKSATGWDGRDPFWLEDTDLTNHRVQLKLGWERWNDQDRIKVQWLDAEDATPAGVPKSDPQTRRSIANRLGAKLRANAGGTPAPAPKPASKTPLQPQKSKQAQGKQTKTATLQEAWEAFAKYEGNGKSQETLEAAWFAQLQQEFGTQDANQITPEQWAEFIDHIETEQVPF